MQNIKLLILVMAIILADTNSVAQKSENPYRGVPFKERIFLGGDLGVSFGSDITYIRVAPVLGYTVSPKFSFGAGPSYQYWEDKRFRPTLESTIWGASAFGRYFLLDQLFIQSEFEVLNLEEIAFTVGSDFDDRKRVTIPVLFVGGGYSQRTASGAGFFVSVLYDVIGDRNSPYPNDIVFRVGGFIGL